MSCSRQPWPSASPEPGAPLSRPRLLLPAGFVPHGSFLPRGLRGEACPPQRPPQVSKGLSPVVRSQPNVTSWETAPLTPLPRGLLTVPPTLTHAGSKLTPVLFVSLLTRPPLPLEPELFHGESARVLLTAGAPSPEIARDVTECHQEPHRGVSSGAACPGSAHLPRPGGGPWRAGLAFLCLLKFFLAGGPSCCSQASTFKPV